MNKLVLSIILGLAGFWTSAALAMTVPDCEASHVGCQSPPRPWRPKGVEVIREINSIFYDEKGVAQVCEVVPLQGSYGETHLTRLCVGYGLKKGDRVKAYVVWHEYWDGGSKAPTLFEDLRSIKPVEQTNARNVW